MSRKTRTDALVLGVAAVVAAGAPCVMAQDGGSDASATVPSPGTALVQSASLRERCIAILESAAASENARYRANAIEGLEVVADRVEPVLRAGLVD